MREKETDKQKKDWHKLLLRHLVVSREQQMKRKLIDLIDELHQNETEQLD